MALTAINRNPAAADLRSFGRLLGPFVAVAGGILAARSGSLRAGLIVWGVGGALTLVYLAAPGARRAIFLGWTYVTYPIGWLISHTVMAAVYFLVFAPIGFLLRRLGRDLLDRRIEPTADSYWVAREPEPGADRYFRQF